MQNVLITVHFLPNTPWFLRSGDRGSLETLQKKEKMPFELPVTKSSVTRLGCVCGGGGGGVLSKYFDIPSVEQVKISLDDGLPSEPTTEVNGNDP